MSEHEPVTPRHGRSCLILLISVITAVLLAACAGTPTNASPTEHVVRSGSPLASATTSLLTATFAATPFRATATQAVLLESTPTIASPASRAPRQFLLNIDVNLAGTPQIPPRMPVTDPNTPTFPPANVEQYVLTHHLEDVRKITIAEHVNGVLDGVTLTTVAAYNAHHADLLPLAGDYLVYVAELHGIYSVEGGAYSPGPRPTFNTAVWVFHAQLGVILAEAIVER